MVTDNNRMDIWQESISDAVQPCSESHWYTSIKVSASLENCISIDTFQRH